MKPPEKPLITHPVPALALPVLGRRTTSPLTAGFWNAAAEHQLAIQRCATCSAHRHPPTAACYRCQSLEWSWSLVSGMGTVFSFVWVDMAMDEALASVVPYNVSLIQLHGTQGDGVRLISNVIGVNRETLQIGLPVEVQFEDLDEGSSSIPVFRPR